MLSGVAGRDACVSVDWHPNIPPAYRNRIVQRDVLEFLNDLPVDSMPLYLFSPPYNLGTTAIHSGGCPGTRLGHYPATAPLGQRGGGRTVKWSGGALAQGYGAYADAMPWDASIDWQHRILHACWHTLTETGAIFYVHKPRILNGVCVLPTQYIPPDLQLRQSIIWARAGGVNVSTVFYLPTCEWILVLAKPGFRLRSKGASGVGDVWRISQETRTNHPCPFPLALAERVLETVQPSLVVDPFMGRGTTAVAARRAGIAFLGCDINVDYVAAAQAWCDATTPTLIGKPVV